LPCGLFSKTRRRAGPTTRRCGWQRRPDFQRPDPRGGLARRFNSERMTYLPRCGRLRVRPTYCTAPLVAGGHSRAVTKGHVRHQAQFEFHPRHRVLERRVDRMRGRALAAHARRPRPRALTVRHKFGDVELTEIACPRKSADPNRYRAPMGRRSRRVAVRLERKSRYAEKGLLIEHETER